MHSSSSASSSSSKISISSLFQYTVLAVLAYVLAGAPLSSLFNSPPNKLKNSNTSTSGAGQSSNNGRELENLVIPETGLNCGGHQFKGVYVMSREPLVVYIEGFLGEQEGDEVVRLSEPHFTPSTIWTSGHESLNPSIRHSEKAPLPRSQTVKCIEERARTFQGWRPYTFIEKLWTQRYGQGGHYTYHYDWSTATKTSGRVSSFMVYIAGECKGGGTHFPRLEKPVGEDWCRFVECDVEGVYGNNSTSTASTAANSSKVGPGKEYLNNGVIFKPIPGNAVYWENMRNDGSGYAESWHAGLPVLEGSKIGLNIWSWLAEGYVPPVKQGGVAEARESEE
ncbi:oxidoreductase 2OG-Fe(II) oxygenase family [Pyrenophora seminiperda CCB06]|uniref:Oxidoreductase 2OG-Fe(II) oxygenase family n=1 Tax=Pyrenophora seminiperda CCB06 TaxID=1302712 RepID=A0A3M7MI33_9PLEO|nr:oxidoreductase 2OG-Fe(II) oxygenase family [Pyrenophora seminiperda CCB06]